MSLNTSQSLKGQAWDGIKNCIREGIVWKAFLEHDKQTKTDRQKSAQVLLFEEKAIEIHVYLFTDYN